MMERGRRKVRVGMVTSDKANKTRIVEVVRSFRTPVYEKVIEHRTKFYVHDENNDSHIGDKVKIMETRPLSKLKRWILKEVIEKVQ
jgi:small subunit ribosomal protein S17